ncbi:MAG: toll/interleukin-1 receptor domain-containing protein [bacterium]|nr:toll/interleukin-1 receptor domain-containing protein [bacterium]
MLFDVFICHASEDKECFVRSLAQRLRESHVEVWFDEFTLRVGDSLRRSIDLGLRQSRFGIVVLSNNFFNKNWPQWELDGLVQRQNSVGENVILPVWHQVTQNDVANYSPSLAEKVATKTEYGLDRVVDDLLKVMKPTGSSLIIARDILIEHGVNPPVVTDDWWLDVAAFSNYNAVEGTFQEASGWERWGFPLPPEGTSPEERGRRLAFAAMQRDWQKRADEIPITQVTPPEEVLAFMSSLPGLLEACHDHPVFLAVYAPQLTIPGLGGEFEIVFEGLFCELVAKNSPHGYPPNVLPLRYPNLDSMSPWGTAEYYFVGAGGAASTGPENGFYEKIDYLLWLLSDTSSWVPSNVRNVLVEGLCVMGTWPWFRDGESERLGFNPCAETEALEQELYRHRVFSAFKLSRRVKRDMLSRFAFSKQLLSLQESPEELVELFLKAGVIEKWYQRHSKRR